MRHDLEAGRAMTQFYAGDESAYAELIDETRKRIEQIERGNLHLLRAIDRQITLAGRAGAFMSTTREHVVAFLIAAASVAALSFYAGRHNQRQATADVQIQAKHDTIVDSIRVTTERIRVDTVRVAAAATAAHEARTRFDSAVSAIEAVADTASVIPTSLVLPGIQTCRVALNADSTLIAELRVTLDDAMHWASLEGSRADLAEAQLAHARPRFGFRSGLLVGAVIGALHFLK